MKRFFLILSLVSATITVCAQSKDFKTAQSLEVQYRVLQTLAENYVDTLQLDKLVTTGIDAMLGSIDPYTTYYPEELEEELEVMTSGAYGGVGALISKRPGSGVVITQPREGTPSHKVGLHPGDTIIAIDGKSILDDTSEQAAGRMKGEPGTTALFKVIRGGTCDTVDIPVTRERIRLSSLAYSGIIRDTVGYALVSGFTDGVADELAAAVEKMKNEGAKRIVVDLRGNGGGLMNEGIKMCSIFLPRGTKVVSSKGRGEGVNHDYYTTDAPRDTAIPLMVMVNSGTASSSEIFSGAMQDLDRAFIAGTRTYGKGLIQSVFPVSYNGNLKVTTGKYYTPSGRCVQAIDYSHHNEDGSVGFIPDSLTHEFKTLKGRTVKDGGGITPDFESTAEMYSRTTTAILYAGILDSYSIKYYIDHKEIAPLEQFQLTDQEYEEFVAFASKQEFDYRSGMDAEIDRLIAIAKRDGVYDDCKEQIEELSKSLKVDKETALRRAKGELKLILESEIASKYYFEPAGVCVNLRDDKQLFKALDNWK